MEVPSPFAGTVETLTVEAGQTVKVGQTILTYARRSAASRPRRRRRNRCGTRTARPTPLAVKASPSVRQMARKLGVDLASLSGSGPEGRILLDDLSDATRPTRPTTPREPARSSDHGLPGTRIKLAGPAPTHRRTDGAIQDARPELQLHRRVRRDRPGAPAFGAQGRRLSVSA